LSVYFYLHQFPEEMDETTIYLQWNQYFKGVQYPGIKFLPENYVHHSVIMSYCAEGKWVFFVSSGNKE